jgi:CheY-like chemotaxis protein
LENNIFLAEGLKRKISFWKEFLTWSLVGLILFIASDIALLVVMIKLKILIIDDEVDYCMIMKSYFQARNYEVFVAYTLKEGFELLEKNNPDILFMDNNLPDGKGWEYVGEIIEKSPSLRIYLISAYRQKSDFISPSLNVTVWEKPISLNQLEEVFS